jgi:hypothetical protein
MAEILFKVGDSGGYRDGDIIAVKGDGHALSGAEMQAWIDEGREPASVASWSGYDQRRYRQRIIELQWKLAHTDAEVEKEYALPAGTAKLDRPLWQSDREKFVTLGCDTNWGFSDMTTHGVLRVEGLGIESAEELTEADYAVDHIGKMEFKRRCRLDYASALPAKKVQDLRDKTQLVKVDRSAAIQPSAIVNQSRATRGVA